jgi:hypothetical protein
LLFSYKLIRLVFYLEAMGSVRNIADDSNKLSDIQLSILRLLGQGISEEEALDVRKMLMDYFDKGLQAELKQVVKEKKYSEQDYHGMLSDDNFAIE